MTDEEVFEIIRKDTDCMDNKFKLGVVKNIENEIVGYNISEDVYVSLSTEEIAHALHKEALRKFQYSSFIQNPKEVK